MTQQIVYLSPNLKVFSSSPLDARVPTLAICFQYLLDDPQLDQPGFAASGIDRLKVAALFVNCASNAWNQYPDLPRALAALRAIARDFTCTVTYGSSMGAYAAIRFASALGARRSIAVAPQYSPCTGVVAGENRYSDLVASVEFLHEHRYRASDDVENFIIFDPFHRVDRRYVDMYRTDASVRLVPVPFDGHVPTAVLSQCSMLLPFLSSLIESRFDGPNFRRAFRQHRRASSVYLQEVRRALAERRHARCRSVGAG